MNTSIHHVGIVVRSISRHCERFLPTFISKECIGKVIFDPLQKVSVCFIDLPGGRIELVEPASEDSPVAALAKKNVAGYHHICVEVDRYDQMIAEAQKTMVVISSPKPAVAFDGRRIAFFMGRDGLLWELLEKEHE